MLNQIRVFMLAVKYWLQGDSWESAVKFGRFIVEGFKTHD